LIYPPFLNDLKKYNGENVTLTAIVTTTVGEKYFSNELNIDSLFYDPEE
jgi:hypothetical protein